MNTCKSQVSSIFLCLLIVLCFKAAVAAEAQSVAEIDAKIAQFITRIEKPSETGNDGVSAANTQLLAYMKRVLADSRLLGAPLPKAHEAGLKAYTSEDGRVCFYSWDTETGGTMHFFYDFVQWKGKNGVHWLKLHPIEGAEGPNMDCGFFYHDLHSVRTADGSTIYLPTYRSIYSHPEHTDGIMAYSIVGDKLVEVPAFQAKSKSLTSIEVPASEVEWDDNDLIKFKDHEQTLLIPITTKDGQVSGRFLTYRFNGHKYVFDEKAHEKPAPQEKGK